jgi:hypothetical protein
MGLGEREARAWTVHFDAISNAAAASRAVIPAGAPELAELLGQFLARHVPVVPDAFAEFANVTLDLELVLLQPGHVEFLAGRAALELAGYVFIVVTDDPDQVIISLPF